MKFNIEVDCTPDEARRFLGLPDVAPFQKVLMDTMEKRMVEFVEQSDPKALLDQWMPMGFKTLEQWPQIWAQMAAAAANFQRPNQPKPSQPKPGSPKKE
jgi:hypothetical protein